ncbi:MAG: TonB-dependent receptor [Candidatus Sulfomarinibacteraceae bacterium]
MSHRPTTTGLAVLSAVLFSASTVAAQQFNQQPAPEKKDFGSEITVTATGIESEVDDVPVATTVITRKQMDDAQSASVTELLRRVPGLSVAQSGDTGSVTSVFTRGTNSNHTLVLFEGVRLNSPYFGGFDWSLPTTTAIERVEVARGPYSALWGSDAVGGVINIIPQRRRGGFGGRILAEGGQENWQRYEATAGFASSHFDIQASGYRLSSDGSLENGDVTGQQGLLTTGFSWGKDSRIGFVYQDLQSEIGIPFVTPGSPTPNRRQDTSQRLMAVPLRWTLAKWWKLEVVTSRTEREIDFTDPDDPWGYVYSTTEADTDQARLANHHTLGRHTISWGGEWREDTVTDVNPFGTALDNVTESTVGAFAQDNWQVNRKFRLLFGVRWDDTDSWGSRTSGRLDFGWRLADTIELRGGYGQAYRAPALGELYGPFGGNPDLKPESSNSGEVGVVYTPVGGHSRWQLNIFTTDIDNLIEYDFASMENQNIGEARINGAEFVWEQGAFEILRWFFQATYLYTRGDDGESLLRRPQYSLAWTLNGDIGKKWSGDTTIRWVSSRDDVDPLTYERVENDSYYTVDISVAWQPWSTVAVTGRVLNVFDEDFQEVVGYPAPGRRFMAGLRWDF